MSKPAIIGIDPGLSGALVLLGAGRPKFHDIPTVRIGKRREVSAALLALALIEWQDSVDDLSAIMEAVGPMPRDSRVGAFKFGDTFGQIKAVLGVLGIAYDLVRPQTWKKALSLPAKSPKDASIGRALQLFPACAPDLTLKKHHNRADALLIAEYERRRRRHG